MKVTMYPTGHDGCAHVRAWWPGEWINGLKLAEVRFSTIGKWQDVEWADLCMFQRTPDRDGAFEWWNKIGVTGKPRVYDSDDDIFHHPWVLGKPYYTDQELRAMRVMMQEADLVTCSTQGVSDAFAHFTSKTRVLPNGVNPAYFHIPITRFLDQVRLGFIAAPAHDEDFAVAAPAIKLVMERHPETRMVFVGHVPEGAKDILPWRQVIHQPWVDYSMLHKTLPALGIEILLVPWKRTPFNIGKSAGKWLDASWMGAATIATRLADYDRLCRHMENAVLVREDESWEYHIEGLIHRPETRSQIAMNARREVKTKYGYDVLAARWTAAYRAVMEGRR